MNVNRVICSLSCIVLFSTILFPLVMWAKCPLNFSYTATVTSSSYTYVRDYKTQDAITSIARGQKFTISNIEYRTQSFINHYMVMDCYSCRYEEVEKLVNNTDLTRSEAEKKVFGYLYETWKIPYAVVSYGKNGKHLIAIVGWLNHALIPTKQLNQINQACGEYFIATRLD